MPCIPSDPELLLAIVTGDESAFQQLHHRYVDHLYRFALGYVHDSTMAADIVQDVFVKFWERRESLRSNDALRAFLFQSTRNAALNAMRELRRRERGEHTLALVETDHSAVASSADLSLERAEERQRVLQAVRTLPLRAREAIVLRWAHGLSYAEIAQAMGVSTETVKTQLARGLLLLKEKL